MTAVRALRLAALAVLALFVACCANGDALTAVLLLFAAQALVVLAELLDVDFFADFFAPDAVPDPAAHTLNPSPAARAAGSSRTAGPRAPEELALHRAPQPPPPPVAPAVHT